MAMKLNLGDPGFNKKMMRFYAWIMPVVFAAMTILMAFGQAWISAGIFLMLALICLPMLNSFWARIHIKGFLKIVLCIGLTILALVSTGLYV